MSKFLKSITKEIQLQVIDDSKDMSLKRACHLNGVPYSYFKEFLKQKIRQKKVSKVVSDRNRKDFERILIQFYNAHQVLSELGEMLIKFRDVLNEA